MYKASSNDSNVKCFDSNNTIYFKVTENRLLKMYTKYGK